MYKFFKDLVYSFFLYDNIMLKKRTDTFNLQQILKLT